jgi:NAD(P)-dependent dehydrogenase (short-subunit alcohol dehydrogenase family)
MTADQFSDALDIMLWGPVHTSLAAIPIMRDHGAGRIVTITSIGGRVPAPHLLPTRRPNTLLVDFPKGCASSWASTASR